MAKIDHVETTPNPLAMKIVLDQKVTNGGSRHYSSKTEAFDSPLVARLFDIHGVSSVFIMDNFLTLNKTQGGIWDYIFFQLNEVLMSMKDIAPVNGIGASGNATVVPAEFDMLPKKDKIKIINEVIDETIRPGLARDGGGLEILDLDEANVLKIKYQGACGSCPSSTTATLNYISNLLQNKVSPNLTVMPA